MIQDDVYTGQISTQEAVAVLGIRKFTLEMQNCQTHGWVEDLRGRSYSECLPCLIDIAREDNTANTNWRIVAYGTPAGDLTVWQDIPSGDAKAGSLGFHGYQYRWGDYQDPVKQGLSAGARFK